MTKKNVKKCKRGQKADASKDSVRKDEKNTSPNQTNDKTNDKTNDDLNDFEMSDGFLSDLDEKVDDTSNNDTQLNKNDLNDVEMIDKDKQCDDTNSELVKSKPLNLRKKYIKTKGSRGVRLDSSLFLEDDEEEQCDWNPTNEIWSSSLLETFLLQLHERECFSGLIV